MNFKPDLNLEYDYIRVVYEVILSELRINKKIIEKDLNTIVQKMKSLKKKETTSEIITIIKTLIKKSKELKTKFDNICKKEEILYNSFEERIEQLKLVDGDNYSFENLKIFCEKKVNNLLLDFFLREKLLDTAKNYIDDEKISNCVEYSIFTEIQNILHQMKHKNLADALKWCNTNKSKLSKIKSDIKFKILCQIFIEKYKENKFKECVIFARENFKDYSSYIKEISQMMMLLAVKPNQIQSLQKYNHLLSQQKWEQLEKDFKTAFFQIYSLKSNSLLEILFQSGIMSLKTSFCFGDKKCLSCPVCSEDIGKLAVDLPYSKNPISVLICRITGEIMDSSNPPMALPNGQVYSEKAIIAQIQANKKFVCPVTNETYKLEQCKKVFIC